MNKKQMIDLFSGKNEVELTDELMKKIVKEKKWSDLKSLKEMKQIGAKWNIKRNSLIFPTEFF